MGDCEALLQALRASVLEGRGRTEPRLRQAVAAGGEVPDDLRVLVDKIHRHAHRVTDEDIALLRATYSDDELFEIVVAASLGGAEVRLRAGLAAIEAA